MSQQTNPEKGATMNDTPTTNDQGETMPVGYSSAGGITFVNVYDPSTHKVVLKDAVVLDLAVKNSTRPITAWLTDASRLLRSTRQSVVARVLDDLIDQIEAQTKPPRIEEPGWSATVEAHTRGRSERRRFVAVGDSLWLERHHDRHAACYSWPDLIDPVLVRDGVQS